MIAGHGVGDGNLPNLGPVNGDTPRVLSLLPNRLVRLLVCNEGRVGQNRSVVFIATPAFGRRRIKECRCWLACSSGKQDLREICEVNDAPHVHPFEELLTETLRLALK